MIDQLVFEELTDGICITDAGGTPLYLFTPEKGHITVTVTAETGGGAVCVGVRDSGPGIAREDLSFMFDRFHQVRGQGDKKIKGNGLGLAFCRQAMRAMGGEISVESTLRLGTEFTIRLGRVA